MLILVQERPLPKVKKDPPNIGEPYKKGDPVGNCIAGYRKGPKNPYVEKLLQKTERE